MPSLLIVTPTLGRSRWLGDVIKLVKFPVPCEHVVVCPEVVYNIVKENAGGARVITEPSGCLGMYAAINHGIRSAVSDWDLLCYVNDDDCLLPEFADLPFSEIEESGVISYGKTHVFDPRGRVNYTGSYMPLGCGVAALVGAGVMPFLQVSMIIPKRVLERVGFFNEGYRYCGDFEFVCRSISGGIQFRFYNLYTSGFRIHLGQLSSDTLSMNRERRLALGFIKKVSGFDGMCDLFMVVFFRVWNLPYIIERISRQGACRVASLFKR